MGYFNKEKPCSSVKVWSRGVLTYEMTNFGVSVYFEFNKMLQNGECSPRGCGFFNESKGMSAFAKKTSGGLGSIMVTLEQGSYK